MIKFNKVFYSKIISLILACVFLFTNITYGIDIPERPHLRKPLDFNGLNVTPRWLCPLLAATYHDAILNQKLSSEEALKRVMKEMSKRNAEELGIKVTAFEGGIRISHEKDNINVTAYNDGTLDAGDKTNEELTQIIKQSQLPANAGGVDSGEEGELFGKFSKFWEENFTNTKKRNFTHAMVNGLLIATEGLARGAQIRIYPLPEGGKGTIGILKIEGKTVLSVRYAAEEGITAYKGDESGLDGRRYDWDWIEERFSLDKIIKIAQGGVEKVVYVKEVYESYIEELGISKEEEKTLRSNLATAAYWCVYNNVTPSKAISIYLKELKVSKEGLSLELKKQLIIATYEVAINKSESSLEKAIQLYQPYVGEKIPPELLGQWLVATYKVAMNKSESSLEKTIQLYQPYAGEKIPPELLGQWLIATYAVAMNKSESSLEKAIQLYQPHIEEKIPPELLGQWLVATYSVAMKKSESSLEKAIQLYQPHIEEKIPPELLGQWLIATYAVAMNKSESYLEKTIQLYQPYVGEKTPPELLGQWLIATYAVAMNKSESSLEKTIQLYQLHIGEKIPPELLGQWLVATYEVAINKSESSLEKAIQLYQPYVGEKIPPELLGQWLVATYEVAINKSESSLEKAIQLYQPHIGEKIPLELLGQWLIATYAVAMNKSESSLEKAIQLYQPYAGENIPPELLGQWLIATYNVAMKKSESSLEKAIQLYQPHIEEKIPPELLGQWLIATYAVAMNKSESSLEKTIQLYQLHIGENIPPELLGQWLIATYNVAMNKAESSLEIVLKSISNVWDRLDPSLKPAILVLTSFWIRLSEQEIKEEIRQFSSSLETKSSIEGQISFVAQYRRAIYERVIKRNAEDKNGGTSNLSNSPDTSASVQAGVILDKYKVLEMGAGLGYFFKQLLSLHHDWDITAIDNNKYAIANTKDRYGLEIKDMDARNTVFADNTFNLVIINYPIFSNTILMDELIKEAYRILKDGGRIEIVTEAPEKGDVRGIPAIKDLLYKSGFSNIEVNLRPEDYPSSNFDYVDLDPNNAHRHLNIMLIIGYKGKNGDGSNLSNSPDMSASAQAGTLKDRGLERQSIDSSL